MCHVARLTQALLPGALRGGSETAVDFVRDVLCWGERKGDEECWSKSKVGGLESGSSTEGHRFEPVSSSRCLLERPSDSGRITTDSANLLQRTRGLKSAHSLPAFYKHLLKPFDETFDATVLSSFESIGVEATIATLEAAQSKLPAASESLVLNWDSDDVDFLLKSSGVLDKRSKEWQTWNWGVIRTIVSGPFRTGTSKLLHGSKFLKRVTGFYSKRLPGLAVGEEPELCLEVGGELIAALLETDEGCAYLSGRGSKNSKQECLVRNPPFFSCHPARIFVPRSRRKTVLRLLVERE
jgi:hypothetical protein